MASRELPRTQKTADAKEVSKGIEKQKKQKHQKRINGQEWANYKFS